MFKSKKFTESNIHFAQPDELVAQWNRNKSFVQQLKAAWSTYNDADLPMTPCIIGKPGMGKTTLAVYCGQTYYSKDIFFFHASPDTKPRDLFCNGVHDGVIQASTLLSAVVNGGTFILEECTRLKEESWSFLLPLLDERQYIRSPLDGRIIKPNKDFRFVAIIDESHIPFEIPEHVYARLSPRIYIEYPDRENLKNILTREDLPEEKELITYLVDFMSKQKNAISIRDGKNILNFSAKLCKNESLDYQTAIHNSAKLISKSRKPTPSSTLFRIK